LAEADAVVEFTSYRRVIVDKGKPQDRWSGQYLLLQPAPHGRPGAQRFNFVVIDREDWQVEPVLEMLANRLGSELGLAAVSQEAKSPEERRRRTKS
jgi:hypothetical protein